MLIKSAFFVACSLLCCVAYIHTRAGNNLKNYFYYVKKILIIIHFTQNILILIRYNRQKQKCLQLVKISNQLKS